VVTGVWSDINPGKQAPNWNDLARNQDNEFHFQIDFFRFWKTDTSVWGII